MDGAEAADTEAEPAGHVPVVNEPDTPVERDGETDGANIAQERAETRKDGRRRPRPAPLDLVSFVPRITASGPEGETSGEGSADTSTRPAFVILTPTALSAELERSAQDPSADRNIVSSLPPIMTHDFSEPRSSLTSPMPSDTGATAGHSSVSLSPPGASANENDEVLDGEHLEERPQSTD